MSSSLYVREAMVADINRQAEHRANVVIAALDGKWTVGILLALRKGPVRLAELRRLIPTATKKMLIESLRRLEHRGLVEREDLSTKMKHVEYKIPQEISEQIFIIVDGLASVEIQLRRTEAE